MTNKEAIKELRNRYRMCISKDNGIYTLPEEIELVIKALEERDQKNVKISFMDEVLK